MSDQSLNHLLDAKSECVSALRRLALVYNNLHPLKQAELEANLAFVKQSLVSVLTEITTIEAAIRVEVPIAPLSAINELEDLAKFYGWLEPLTRKSTWRLVPLEDRVRGGIKGLTHVYGWLVATDGLECLLFTGEPKLFCGHLDWFIPDEVVDTKNFFRKVRGEAPLDPSEATKTRVLAKSLASKYADLD